MHGAPRGRGSAPPVTRTRVTRSPSRRPQPHALHCSARVSCLGRGVFSPVLGNNRPACQTLHIFTPFSQQKKTLHQKEKRTKGKLETPTLKRFAEHTKKSFDNLAWRGERYVTLRHMHVMIVTRFGPGKWAKKAPGLSPTILKVLGTYPPWSVFCARGIFDVFRNDNELRPPSESQSR